MRVLLIAQDGATQASVRTMLVREKFDTTEVDYDSLEISRLDDYDVIVLDLSLPRISGYQVLKQLRRERVRTPVLILTGFAELDSRIKGLGFGVGDVLTNPFDHRELIARIQTIARRPRSTGEATVRTGKLVVNLDTREVSVDDRAVHLTTKEYGILELLAMLKSTTLTKEMFLNHLYGGMDEPEVKIIDVFVCKLRKKLAEATGGNHYIETVWGRGYRLSDPPSSERPAPMADGNNRVGSTVTLE